MWIALLVTVVITPALTYYAPGQEVCYSVVGCFNHTYPFNNTDFLPDSPGELDVKLQLYSRRNQQTPDLLSFTDKSLLKRSHFDPNKPVKVLVHGYNSDPDSWINNMKDEFLKHNDYNVVAVDWAKASKNPYGQAVANTRLVAEEVSQLLQMMEDRGLDRENIHLIGHSLGAHIVGTVGHSLDSEIGRITALDAAYPNYEDLHPLVNVDITDALFVDAIHTDSGGYSILQFKGYGLNQPLGHVDFYPNGGEEQPGCNKLFGRRQFRFGNLFDCAHSRAHSLFAQSINAAYPFKSFTCSDYESYVRGKCTDCRDEGWCSSMGFHADKFKGRGKQFLRTTGQEPFGGYQYKVVATLEQLSTVEGELHFRLIGDTGFSTSDATLKTKEAKLENVTLQGVIIVDKPIIPIKYIHARFKPADNYETDATPFVIKELQIISLDDGKRHVIESGTYSIGGEEGVNMPIFIDELMATIG